MRYALLGLLLCLLALGAVPAAASDAVSCIQQGLTDLGYHPGPVDGLLGNRTVGAAHDLALDQGLNLPALSAGSADRWCAEMKTQTLGAGAIPLDPADIDTAGAEGVPVCVQTPPDGYAREIHGRVDGDDVTMRISSRFGGAVESLKWRGKEFINIFDHGRQVSYAWSLDGFGECYNPTEPGSAADLFQQHSTSELLSVCSDTPHDVSTRTRPAYWMPPGYKTGLCEGGATGPINQTAVSDHLLEKTITLGAEGFDNVIRYDAAITLDQDHNAVFLEIPTTYLTADFTDWYEFDPLAGTLSKAETDALQEPWSFLDTSDFPPILSTPDGEYAIGAYTTEPIDFYTIQHYDVPNPHDRTTVMDMVTSLRPAPKDTYRFTTYAMIGTLEEVQQTMQALFKKHPTDLQPPEGYVDLADCNQISGWAWDPKAPDHAIDVEVYDIAGNGERTLIGRKPANELRLDLPPVLKDNGRHGWNFWTYQVIKDGKRHTISVEAVNSAAGLDNRALIPAQQTVRCPELGR